MHSIELTSARLRIAELESELETLRARCGDNRPQESEDRFHLCGITERQLLQTQKFEEMKTLAGRLAHKLNNSLSAIMGFTEMALFSLRYGENPTKELEQVVEATEQATELLQEILEFSHGTQHEFDLLDLSHSVRHISPLLRSFLPRVVEIETKFTSAPTIISGNQGQLEQIVLSLATNAAEAMPEGGTLTLATSVVSIGEKERDELRDLDTGRCVLLTVSDTGNGMDSNTIGRIYDPFFTTKNSSKRSGMGLSMVLGLVKLHDARILCESTVNVGTTFKIYFPLAEGHSEKPPHTSSSSSPVPS